MNPYSSSKRRYSSQRSMDRGDAIPPQPNQLASSSTPAKSLFARTDSPQLQNVQDNQWSSLLDPTAMFDLLSSSPIQGPAGTGREAWPSAARNIAEHAAMASQSHRSQSPAQHTTLPFQLPLPPTSGRQQNTNANTMISHSHQMQSTSQHISLSPLPSSGSTVDRSGHPIGNANDAMINEQHAKRSLSPHLAPPPLVTASDGFGQLFGNSMTSQPRAMHSMARYNTLSPPAASSAISDQIAGSSVISQPLPKQSFSPHLMSLPVSASDGSGQMFGNSMISQPRAMHSMARYNTLSPQGATSDRSDQIFGNSVISQSQSTLPMSQQTMLPSYLVPLTTSTELDQTTANDVASQPLPRQSVSEHTAPSLLALGASSDRIDKAFNGNTTSKAQRIGSKPQSSTFPSPPQSSAMSSKSKQSMASSLIDQRRQMQSTAQQVTRPSLHASSDRSNQTLGAAVMSQPHATQSVAQDITLPSLHPMIPHSTHIFDGSNGIQNIHQDALLVDLAAINNKAAADPPGRQTTAPRVHTAPREGGTKRAHDEVSAAAACKQNASRKGGAAKKATTMAMGHAAVAKVTAPPPPALPVEPARPGRPILVARDALVPQQPGATIELMIDAVDVENSCSLEELTIPKLPGFPDPKDRGQVRLPPASLCVLVATPAQNSPTNHLLSWIFGDYSMYCLA